MGTVPLCPQGTPTGQGEERAEGGRHPCVPATGDQSNEDHETPCQGERAAAGEVWGAFRGNRLKAVEEEGEQSLTTIDRCGRFCGSSGLSWFHCQ